MDCPYDTVPTMCDDCERIEPDLLREQITTDELLDELVLRTKNVEGRIALFGGDATDAEHAKLLRRLAESMNETAKAIFARYNGLVEETAKRTEDHQLKTDGQVDKKSIDRIRNNKV